MEGRILSEIPSLVDFPLITLHAVCRSSVCGLALAYESKVHRGGNYSVYARQLADRLEFGSYYAGHSVRRDGSRFTRIYLGDADTPGLYNIDLPATDPPKSFEEIFEESRNATEPE